MQFPISFLPFSFEPTRIGLLPWHSNNMILINAISDTCSVLDLSEVFGTVHYAFLKHSFHRTSRASYFPGFTSSYWLTTSRSPLSVPNIRLGLGISPPLFPETAHLVSCLQCHLYALHSRILCLPGYSAAPLYWLIHIPNVTSHTQ